MRAATDEIVVQDRTGNVRLGVSGISIVKESDSTPATIYTTRTGSTTIPQSSLTTDQDGYVVQPGGGAAFVDLDDYLVSAPGSRQIHWDVTGGAVNSVDAETGDVSLGVFLGLAANPDQLVFGSITRDADGAATTASVTWPDGDTGTYTGIASTAVPGAVDSYTITKGTGGAMKTYTQPTVTRDASGVVTVRPAITVT